MSGNPDAKEAAKRAKEARQKGKVYGGGRIERGDKRVKTMRKRANGKKTPPADDPRVK